MRQRALGLEEVLALQREGAQVLDVRDGSDYEGAHLTGAVNVGLGGSFATWCGTLPARDERVTAGSLAEQLASRRRRW